MANWLEKTLALSATGLLFYLPALLLPLMTLETLGMTDTGNVFDTLLVFFQNGYYIVALVVLITAVLFPLLLLSLVFAISVFIALRRSPAFLLKFFRLYIFFDEWAMIEIYLLGIMITIMKMRHTAEIHFNTGFFCFTALVLITMGIRSFLDKEQIWSVLSAKGKTPCSRKDLVVADQGAERQQTALRAGFNLCSVCRQLQPMEDVENTPKAACTRCGSRIHNRKPDSISRTWALILTSAFLLVPANLLPIMQVKFLGIPEYSTIVDGIIYFFQEGSFLIGLIILTASVLVPLFKILGLIILLYTTYSRKGFQLKKKTALYRCISFIGRWSMLDIFVIGLLTVLVNFGFLTSIQVAPAATYFCMVVASTMLAATTFDSRLMWDSCQPDQPAGLLSMVHEPLPSPSSSTPL